MNPALSFSVDLFQWELRVAELSERSALSAGYRVCGYNSEVLTTFICLILHVVKDNSLNDDIIVCTEDPNITF